MFAQLLTPDYMIFTIAFVVMLGIGAIEAAGLGIGHFDFDEPADLAGDLSGAPGVLDWLGLKSGFPMLVWLTSLLACFTIAGVAIQQIATALQGAPLGWVTAGLAALVVGLIGNGFAAGALQRILPEYESTVIDTDDLIMRRGVVLEGSARRGHPARAKVIDQHGQAHVVMVEPHLDGDVVAQGETALLVRRAGPLFFIQPENNTTLRPL